MDVAEGEQIYVFYRGDHPHMDHVYMACIDSRHGAYRPRMGLTQGWVLATVGEHEVPEHISSGGKMKTALHSWPHYYDERGRCYPGYEEPIEGPQSVAVVPATKFSDPMLGFLPGHTYRPKLSIISFRWGGKNQIVVPEQWGHTGSSCSGVFLDSLIADAVKPQVGNNFEVWSVFIEDSSDLVKVADAAHLIFGPNHPARRAEHCCAMYFLYPTSFEENCVPTAETGEDEGAAHVDQKSLFRMMKAMEKTGIQTQFPHSSGFYELLTSKRWTHMMTLTPHLRVPPTVALPRMLIEKDLNEAAAYAIKALRSVRKQQAILRNEDAAKADQPITKGVAKLGFSWEALDVKFWEGEEGLQTALYALTQAIEISGNMTGQPHDCESLLIQEYCQHDIELRLYVVNGKVEGRIYTKFCKIKPNNEFGDFHQHFEPEPVAADWMEGDRAALDDGEAQCRQLVEHWMAWVEAQICDVPPGIRFDFFIGRSPQKGKAVVWTLEICELGFSMLGEPALPKKVFEAMLHHCLDKTLDLSSNAPAAAAAAANAGAKNGMKGANKAPVPDVAPKAAPQGGKANASNPDIVQTLYINVPIGSNEQMACTGEYALEEKRANNAPVWKKRSPLNPERYVYFSEADSYWYVGDNDEKKKNFKCNEGYVRCEGGKDGRVKEMPQMTSSAWEIYSEEGDKWEENHAILVALEADVLTAEAPAKGGQGDGSKGGGQRRRNGKGKRR